MIGNLPKNKKDRTISPYMPPQVILDITKKVRDDYETGDNILKKTYREFNDKTLEQRQEIDQKAFNSYSDPQSADPDRNWQWKGVKPITRNKIISIAAHITADVLVPNVFAQNKADEEDKDVSSVMGWLIEWNIKNSDYDLSFLAGVISALTNPAVIVNVEFAEVMQKIKTKKDNGDVVLKEIIDDFFSGLKTNIVPCEELLINNIYENDIQKQKCLIRRRYTDYDTMRGKYGDKENFNFVSPGIRIFYNEEEGLFYENKDDDHPTLCEEVIYYNRREDTEIPFVNGIYMGEPDPENSMMKHRRVILDQDEQVVTIPVYPFAKSGYEFIDEKRFFYYKSVAFKLTNDQNLINRMYRMVMDGTFLQTMPPVAGFGTGAINGSVFYPGAFTPFSKDASVQRLDNGANLNWGYSAIQTIEDSMSESSQSEVAGGALPEPEQKAFTVARAEQNAKIQLGLFGKMISQLVVDMGYLMVDIIISHQTIPSIDEITAGDVRAQYRTFLLPEKVRDGKKVTKKIIFTDEYSDRPMTEDEELKESFKLLKQDGEDTEIYKVNPYLFSRMRYLISIDADLKLSNSEAFEKAWNLEALDRGINNPYLDQEKWIQEHLVEVFHKGDSERFMTDPEEAQMQLPQQRKRELPKMEKKVDITS